MYCSLHQCRSRSHNIRAMLLDVFVVLLSQVNIMSNINEPFVDDGGRFEVVFMSLASARYQLRLSILGQFTCLLVITFAALTPPNNCVYLSVSSQGARRSAGSQAQADHMPTLSRA